MTDHPTPELTPAMREFLAQLEYRAKMDAQGDVRLHANDHDSVAQLSMRELADWLYDLWRSGYVNG